MSDMMHCQFTHRMVYTQHMWAVSCRSSGCCCPPSTEARSDETTERFPSGRSPQSHCRGLCSCNKHKHIKNTHTHRNHHSGQRVEKKSQKKKNYLQTSFRIISSLEIMIFSILVQEKCSGKDIRQNILQPGSLPTVSSSKRERPSGDLTCPLPHSNLLGWFQAESLQGSSLPTSSVQS